MTGYISIMNQGYQLKEDQYPEIFTLHKATILQVYSDKGPAMSKIMPHFSRKSLNNKSQQDKKETEKSLHQKDPSQTTVLISHSSKAFTFRIM